VELRIEVLSLCPPFNRLQHEQGHQLTLRVQEDHVVAMKFNTRCDHHMQSGFRESQPEMVSLVSHRDLTSSMASYPPKASERSDPHHTASR
jgi:hypothetical protein